MWRPHRRRLAVIGTIGGVAVLALALTVGAGFTSASGSARGVDRDGGPTGPCPPALRTPSNTTAGDNRSNSTLLPPLTGPCGCSPPAGQGANGSAAPLPKGNGSELAMGPCPCPPPPLPTSNGSANGSWATVGGNTTPRCLCPPPNGPLGTVTPGNGTINGTGNSSAVGNATPSSHPGCPCPPPPPAAESGLARSPEGSGPAGAPTCPATSGENAGASGTVRGASSE